jgi:hypothetical protein
MRRLIVWSIAPMSGVICGRGVVVVLIQNIGEIISMGSGVVVQQSSDPQQSAQVRYAHSVVISSPS